MYEVSLSKESVRNQNKTIYATDIDSGLSKNYFDSIFDCHFDVGNLIWKHRTDVFKGWNARYAGKLAGYIKKSDGYHCVKINGRKYLSHRVIWMMYYGIWPQDQLDHINRIRTDNRIDNLREVNNQKNQFNRNIGCNNTSGTTGVSFEEQNQKWHSRIGVNGQSLHLGYFPSKEDAITARLAAEIEYFGEFASAR